MDDLKDVKPLDNFDWDRFENDSVESTKGKEEIDAAYNRTLSPVQEHDVVEGKIIGISKREVIVDIGYKSDGIIPAAEFRYNPDLKVGDTVEVYIEKEEDAKGQLVLSHRKARMKKGWDRINQAMADKEVIKGYVKFRTKGGMIVDVFGIEAFLPGSQIDVKAIHDYDAFVGTTMDFQVIKINQEYRNVVVSHKALIEAEIEAQKREIISHLEKGQVLEGTIKNIQHYGAFVDLGGVDGLIHITDLSWGRVNDPTDIVQVGQKLNVVILDFDLENGKQRIALGLKQLTPHPWDALDPNLKEGDIVHGKVVVVTDYGAFVEVAPSVEGLVHVSEMSWSTHLKSAQDFFKVGDELDAVILNLDRQNRKMSLGVKQLHEDPWQTIETRYPIGSKHTARVRNFTNFGAFVELEDGVDGLVHVSDMSWTKRVKHPSEITKIGADLDVIVLDIDKENRRLGLGHKQCEENPWDVFETVFTVGSIHEGTIVEERENGDVVQLEYGIEGFATPKHLMKEDHTKAKLGEKLRFKVLEFNKLTHRIILSHSRIFEDEQRNERRAKDAKSGTETPQVQNQAATTTLGDIDALAKLKASLSEGKTAKPETEKDEKKAPKTVKEEETANEAPAKDVESAEPTKGATANAETSEGASEDPKGEETK